MARKPDEQDVQAPVQAGSAQAPSTTLLVMVALGTTVAVASAGAGAWLLLGRASRAPSTPVAAEAPPPTGPWEPYTLDESARAALAASNARAPAELPLVAGNKVPGDMAVACTDPNAPLVRFKLDGHGAADQPPQPVMRLPTAASFAAAARRMKELHDVQPRVLRSWTSRAELDTWAEKFPSLAAQPFSTGFLLDGFDLSRTDVAGRQPLTLDHDGQVILLDELQNEAGRRRFEDVVRVILADVIKAQPRDEARLVAEWVNTAEVDLARGVWGVHEAMMEVLAEAGLGSGHCGGAPGRAWHVEPLHGPPPCRRFDATWVDRITEYRAGPGPAEEQVARTLDLAVRGPWQPYLLDETEWRVNAAVNLGLPGDHALVSFNRVSTRVAGALEDADAPLAWLTLPGRDREGAPLRLQGRLPTVELVSRVAAEVQQALGLSIRPNLLWRSNARQHQLHAAMPRVAPLPGQSNHAGDAVDISRAEATGKTVLTLGVDGMPIYLSELDMVAGRRRFEEVVRRIEADTLATAKPAVAARIVAGWVKSAQEDYDAGVWGMPDVTMEVWRKHGWTLGHCGENAQETWHAEPIQQVKTCERWDATYNRRIRAHRKAPPAREDKVLEREDAVLARPPPSADAVRAVSRKLRLCGAACQR